MPPSIAQRVNVEGTGNVLDFCRGAERLERLNYVSTAYVAGDRTGVVYEHELDLGQGFKNHYESTKFQAEVWVRELMDTVPTTIYRPGDRRRRLAARGRRRSSTAPTTCCASSPRPRARGMPIANIGRGATPFNVVPVDFIVDAMVALGRADRRDRRDRSPLRPRAAQLGEMFELLSRALRRPRASYRVPPRVVAAALRFGADPRRLRRHPGESIRYLNHPVRYDTRRAGELLAALGPALPALPRSTRRRWSASSASTRTIRRWRRRRLPGNHRPIRG